MKVLIVEGDPDTGWLWRRHLERQGCEVSLSHTQDEAIELLRTVDVSVIVLDLIMEDGSAFAIADFASYRRPGAKIIFVNNSSFFSDGSIFQHIPNACAVMPAGVAADDLSALVEHYGTVH
jgi:DNA-binding NtrC family response regulator